MVKRDFKTEVQIYVTEKAIGLMGNRCSMDGDVMSLEFYFTRQAYGRAEVTSSQLRPAFIGNEHLLPSMVFDSSSTSSTVVLFLWNITVEHRQYKIPA